MEKIESETWERAWQYLNNARLIRYLLLFALGWVIVQVLAYFEMVIVIFSFAAILAFLLNYPVRWLQNFVPHSVAVILVLILTLFIMVASVATIGVTLLSQGQQLVEQFPDLLNSASTWLEQFQQSLESFNLRVDLERIQETLNAQALQGLALGLTTLQGLLFGLVDFILVLVVAFFMLLDRGRLWHFFIQKLPDRLQVKFSNAIRDNLLGFFWGRLLLSIFFGVSCFLVFLLLQVPYALLLAAIAGAFDLIPGIGATIGVILISLILLPQGIWLSITVIVSCVLLQQVEENLLMPRVMQGSINMNPVVMFFALLVGARIAGIFGIFLSIPVAGVMISLLGIEEMQGS